jgi:alkanesulfonate monooxygenase SsuD/methylene tetrahydromethanopterin reductase-like flavin-dependent oxidoreductase (luciferase family)
VLTEGTGWEREVVPMRFGIILDGGNRPGQSREEAFLERLKTARQAKRHGFHSLWVGQGYLNNGWHATALLARVTAEVPGIELGMVALLPLQHPVELAEQIATLDVMCGGRFVLAAALGWRDVQFRAFGVPQSQRLSRFQEVLAIMQQLWTQECITYRGRYFQLEEVPGAGKPLQRPFPRLLIAANLDPGVVRAAKMADGWLISSRATLPTIRRQVQLYGETLTAAKRQGSIAAWREMYVAEDRATAIKTIRPYVEWLYRDRAALGHNRALPETDRIDVPFEQVLEGRFILGSAEECAAEVAKYQELGVEELILRCQWPGMPGEDALRAVRLFGREVLPRFVA